MVATYFGLGMYFNTMLPIAEERQTVDWSKNLPPFILVYTFLPRFFGLLPCSKTTVFHFLSTKSENFQSITQCFTSRQLHRLAVCITNKSVSDPSDAESGARAMHTYFLCLRVSVVLQFAEEGVLLGQ